MTILKKAEFSRACGVSSPQVSMWLKRENIVATDDGKIDITNLVNHNFIENRKAAGGEFDLNVAARKSKNVAGAVKPAQEQKAKQEAVPVQKKDSKLAALQRKKVELEVEKLEHATMLEKLKVQKMQGTLIPVDAVAHLFGSSIATIHAMYKQNVDGQISILKSRAEIGTDIMIDIKKDLITAINEIAAETKKELLKSLDGIIEEYKEVRGRGEKR